ncbi:hypothetical protein MgSA37_01646 [Mucilaginibacter gotjawali]|uniref:Uncharacterized protein n=1 Tax=Mucilaginibacter gotjawali TaxID=1550579 RepID=A0A0X8X1L8_9SPHI|nr:hypothetical protein MgSA37_01646 [Mucilaginibacter gotjawali]
MSDLTEIRRYCSYYWLMDPAKSQEISVPESMGTESTREIYYPDLKSTIKIFLFIFYIRLS